MVGALVAKQLELMREVLPGVTRIAILLNPNNPVMSEDTLVGAQMAAARLGLEIIVVKAATENEIEAAFGSAVQQGAAALLAEDAYFIRKQVAAVGLRNNLPTLSVPQAVADGALMGYGASIPASYRRPESTLDVFSREKNRAICPFSNRPSSIWSSTSRPPRRSASTVPPTLLARADEVIE